MCIVNDHCREVYSSYVSVDQPITDYRTAVSGITPRHVANAPSFDHVRALPSRDHAYLPVVRIHL